jgi:acyl-CoA thioesterase
MKHHDNDIVQDPFAEQLGITWQDVTGDTVVAALTVRPEHLNRHGTVHGGVLFSLADAVFAFVSNRPGRAAVALDTNMTFVTPARVGETVVAEGREEALRRQVAVYSVRLTVGDRLVALFRGTVFRKPDEPPSLGDRGTSPSGTLDRAIGR